ncbi:MAG TPA: UDP-N-acetylmuramoylalanyl-D-glutamyl-2, 6-diaminopimelate--D-alanyl-D-alanine ligase, partial [Burkholderiaceae bacterium]
PLCAHAAQACGTQARHYADTAALLAALADPAAAPAFESALVKGSRFMGMERVVALLAERDAAEGQGGAHAA